MKKFLLSSSADTLEKKFIAIMFLTIITGYSVAFHTTERHLRSGKRAAQSSRFSIKKRSGRENEYYLVYH